MTAFVGKVCCLVSGTHGCELSFGTWAAPWLRGIATWTFYECCVCCHQQTSQLAASALPLSAAIANILHSVCLPSTFIHLITGQHACVVVCSLLPAAVVTCTWCRAQKALTTPPQAAMQEVSSCAPMPGRQLLAPSCICSSCCSFNKVLVCCTNTMFRALSGRVGYCMPGILQAVLSMYVLHASHCWVGRGDLGSAHVNSPPSTVLNL